jgi:hypothetical protein
MIDHPFYGPGTQFGLANLEVMEHNCMDYIRARRKSPRGKARESERIDYSTEIRPRSSRKAAV